MIKIYMEPLVVSMEKQSKIKNKLVRRTTYMSHIKMIAQSLGPFQMFPTQSIQQGVL